MTVVYSKVYQQTEKYPLPSPSPKKQQNHQILGIQWLMFFILQTKRPKPVILN